VDLVDAVEAAGGVGHQQAGKPGRETGANHDVQTALARFGVEVEQALHVVDRVGGRHHVGTPLERPLHDRALAHRSRQQHDVVAFGKDIVAVGLSSRIPERLDDGRPERLVTLHDDEVFERGHREKLAGGAGANSAGADEDDSHEQEV
jgi:hypothetical protein